MRTLFLLLAAFALPLCAEQVTIQVLATTDMHGNLMPYDYFTARPAQRGLAKVATLIREQRKQNPNTLLVDTGDTIQGAPLESVYQAHALEAGAPPDPMMLAMNALAYDAMVVGNHEFNFGLKNLNRAREAARFPWLSANTKSDGSVPQFAPYIVKTIAGVKVAFIGITTPAIPTWEKPENYKGYSWTSAVKAAAEAVATVRAQERPDVVLLGVHAGLGSNTDSYEDMVRDIATTVKGIDAILFGHSHQQLEPTTIGQTLVAQPKNWAMSLAKIELTLERDKGPWRVAAKSGRLLRVTEQVAADPEIVRIAQPYHDTTERYLNQTITEAPAAISATRGRVEDTAIIDAIQEVEMYYAKADVSMTAVFNPRAVIPKGPVTVRQIAALYIYDNELFAIEGSGRMLREALENAARYFNTCADPACSNAPLINRNVLGFNFDVAAGVSYDIDLTQPPGQRIRNLSWKGQPLTDTQPLRLAINNYRAGGSGGYSMFKGSKILWRSYEDIRDLIIRYYSSGHQLPAAADNNWRIVPDTARQKLATESEAEARKTRDM